MSLCLKPTNACLYACLIKESQNVVYVLLFFHLTHYQMTNFRLFPTERVCRQQFQIWWKWQKVIQMGRKHCGEKGEIARYEQFLIFPRCFQKACLPGASKGVIVWEWVKYVIVTWEVREAFCKHLTKHCRRQMNSLPNYEKIRPDKIETTSSRENKCGREVEVRFGKGE